jgi:hypothetical protein
MHDVPESLRLDRGLILEREADGGYAWHPVDGGEPPPLTEMVSRARTVLKRTRDDLAVIDHSLAQETDPAKQNLYLDKRKRRQDAERFLADFLGWVARRST